MFQSGFISVDADVDVHYDDDGGGNADDDDDDDYDGNGGDDDATPVNLCHILPQIFPQPHQLV